MRVEAKKTFKNGFALSEQELRRLVSELRQQAEKVSVGNNPVENYVVKFRNGAIAEALSLDNVLSQENVGSGAIVRLKIELQDSVTDPKSVITTEFINAKDEGEVGSVSMRYTVIGEDRDWVFVTSSELEERLGRIKKVNFSRFWRAELFTSFFTFLFMISLTLSMVFSVSKMDYPYIDQVENAWRSGELSDPIEVMIALERGSKGTIGDIGKLFIPMGYAVLVGIVGVMLIWGMQHFFPPYNFCWGDYVKIYEKKQAQGKFIYVTVLLLAIIIPIAVSLISSLIERSVGF